MITRTAIFEGRIKDGFEELFFEGVKQRLAPLWHQFPKGSNVRMFRITEADSDSPPIVMIQQIDYPTMADLEAVLASPIRTQARAVTMELLEMFEGRFYHVISHGDPVEAAA